MNALERPILCSVCHFPLVPGKNWSEGFQRRRVPCCKKCTPDGYYPKPVCKPFKRGIVKRQTAEVRYKALQDRIKRAKLACDLDFDQYRVLLAKKCEYCGWPLDPTGVGLDQIIPGAGYTRVNVVPCCGICNGAKGRWLTYEEMKRVGVVISQIRTDRKHAGQIRRADLESYQI
jgi:hypothetical protein